MSLGETVGETVGGSSAASVVVVLPTYNESQNIERMVRAVRDSAPAAHIMVIDDNSPDGTGRIADRLAEELDRVQVVHRTLKAGLGSAYRDGFARAIAAGHEVVVSMDVDFSHDPAVIPTVLAAIDSGADAVIGSRYVPGGGTRDWPLHRRLLSRWGNLYTGFAIGARVRDCTSGFRAYRASALAAIAPETTRAEGYAFLTELVLRLSRLGFVVREVPITFVERQYGTSKMSARIIAESMLLVTRWGISLRWERLRGRR